MISWREVSQFFLDKMKLKTLKDIECLNPTHNHKTKGDFCIVKKSDLKQEAIKWIIEDIKALRQIGMVAKNIIAWDLLRVWMKRLNITKEDLK